MVKEGAIIAQSGKRIEVGVDLICVHGDHPNAVAMARAVRSRLEARGRQTRAFRAGAGMTGEPRYLPAGESALVVEFGQRIDEAVNDRVLALDEAVAAARLAGVIETVPTYRSLMIHFDPRQIVDARR